MEGFGGREMAWKKLAFIPAATELALAAMAMEWQCGVVEPPPILSVLVLPPLFDFAGIHPRHLRPDLKFQKLLIEFQYVEKFPCF